MTVKPVRGRGFLQIKIILRILMNKRIQPTPTIIHAVLLEIPIRNMNKVKMIEKPGESIMLAGKVY
jgi:hypothetical protein